MSHDDDLPLLVGQCGGWWSGARVTSTGARVTHECSLQAGHELPCTCDCGARLGVKRGVQLPAYRAGVS